MSANAIETLRGIVGDCQDVLSAPDVDRGMDALAAVETLLEAAKAWTQVLADEWVREADPSDPYEIPPPWRQDGLAELFAAVRRVETGQ